MLRSAAPSRDALRRRASDEDANRRPEDARRTRRAVVSGRRRASTEAIPPPPACTPWYDDDDEIQYIGLSRGVSASVKLHAFELPLNAPPRGARPSRDAAVGGPVSRKAWMLEHIATRASTADERPGARSGPIESSETTPGERSRSPAAGAGGRSLKLYALRAVCWSTSTPS